MKEGALPALPLRCRLILASASPRRRELLAALGLRFEVRPVDLDESQLPGESPALYVERLAREKATAHKQAHKQPGEVVIGADTTVVLGEGNTAEILAKPTSLDDSRAMLRALRGRWHTVLTGVAISGPERTVSAVASSQVAFVAMDEEEVAWYAATQEGMDKAGGYAVQGIGAMFVQEIRGNYTNVVGLPLPLLQQLLRQLGLDLRSFRADGTVAGPA